MALSALRQRVGKAASPLLDTPPDEVVFVAANTIPKTASGKPRRTTARDLFERHQLASRPRSLRQQLLRLGIAGLRSRLRRVLRICGDYIYAGWWWSVAAVIGALLWPLLLLLPGACLPWAVMRHAARAAFRLMGIRIEVTGTWPQPVSPIMVANHASYLDGLVFAAAIPGTPALVAKKELKTQFFAGPFLRKLGALFVDRSDPESGVADLNKVLDEAKTGRTLVIPPEGTFTRAPGLLPFHLGAFIVAARQHLDVLPLTLRGTGSILRSDQWFPRRGAISVQIGSPNSPTGSDFASAVLLRDKVRAEILAACGEPDAVET